MAANRHPGFIPNMTVNALINHTIIFKYQSMVPLILSIPLSVPFMTDSGTGVSPGLKVEFINRSRRGKAKKANVKMRQGLKR